MEDERYGLSGGCMKRSPTHSIYSNRKKTLNKTPIDAAKLITKLDCGKGRNQRVETPRGVIIAGGGNTHCCTVLDIYRMNLRSLYYLFYSQAEGYLLRFYVCIWSPKPSGERKKKYQRRVHGEGWVGWLPPSIRRASTDPYFGLAWPSNYRAECIRFEAAVGINQRKHFEVVPPRLAGRDPRMGAWKAARIRAIYLKHIGKSSCSSSSSPPATTARIYVVS